MSNPFNLELFDSSRHERSSFDCGEPALNDYLKKYAKQILIEILRECMSLLKMLMSSALYMVISP